MRYPEVRDIIREIGLILSELPMSETAHNEAIRRFTLFFQKDPWKRTEAFDAGEFRAWCLGIDDAVK